MKKTGTAHKIYNYIAVFNPAEEGGFNVSFPAFPGCVTFGRTFEEAKEKAGEILGLWLEELFARRERIPTRRSRPIIDEVEVTVRTRQMRSLPAKHIVKVLLKHGFVIVRQRGSHQIYRHRESGVMVPVPFHGGNKPLPFGTFLAIMKQSKIPKSGFK